MTINLTLINDVAVVQNAADTTINLFNTFDDPRTTGLVARFELYNTNLAGGISNVLLFDQEDAGAPLTVENFQTYVEDGDYTNSIIHRSIPGFVVQGGGFNIENSQVGRVSTNPSVQNEFSTNRSNLRGTVAMAKLGGDPNSATSQWFFNLADNSSNLDDQNGGFTVFGEVLSNADLAVADAIAALPRVDATSLSSAFDTLPFDSDDNTLDKQEEFVRYKSITISQQDELTFEVVSNSNPAIASAVINNGSLILDYANTQFGNTTIVIQATNLLGETLQDTFVITTTEAPAPSIDNPSTLNPSQPSAPTNPTTLVSNSEPNTPTNPTTPVSNPELGTDRNTNPPVGSGAADNLSGGADNNILNGLGGNDTLLGLDGDDQLLGGGGQDKLFGGDGEDILKGGGSKDKLVGGNGGDTLDGGGGKDNLNGGNGNDELFGGGGNDKLKGGKGRDILDGGKGNNLLIGGKSKDVFVISKGKGRSVIRDFRDRQDSLRTAGVPFKSLTIEQAGKNTLIRSGGDELALLKGVDASLISRSDFD